MKMSHQSTQKFFRPIKWLRFEQWLIVKRVIHLRENLAKKWKFCEVFEECSFLTWFPLKRNLYSVTDLPISIEMISSWIQIVPEFVWMWGCGSPSRNDSWLVFTFFKWMFVSDWPIPNCFETETHHATSTQIRGQSESTRKSFLKKWVSLLRCIVALQPELHPNFILTLIAPKP